MSFRLFFSNNSIAQVTPGSTEPGKVIKSLGQQDRNYNPEPDSVLTVEKEKTTILEELKLMLTFKKKWFIQALIKRLF